MTRATWLRIGWRALAWGTGAYALVVLGAFLLQRRLIYPAPPTRAAPFVPGAKLERISGESGSTVHALYREPSPGAPVVVHFHGNGETLGDQRHLIQTLALGGLGVFAVEYPGYGLSHAETPSEESLYAAAEAALSYLQRERGIPRERIVLQGQSLGTGVAVEMAARGHGNKLVLLSPFTTMAEAAQRVLPIVPTALLLRDRYANLAKVKAIRIPSLVVHGTQDGLIPFSMGQRVSEALPRSRLVEVEGAGHNDLFSSSAVSVLDEIVAFARE
jgi:pimeloyl-ACP methyl ester carboxylesterase